MFMLEKVYAVPPLPVPLSLSLKAILDLLLLFLQCVEYLVGQLPVFRSNVESYPGVVLLLERGCVPYVLG